jgi:hypothetical protein
MPASIFDKTRLLTPEFARYIYKGAGGTRDMNLAGYKRAIEGVIVGTEVKDVKFHSYSYQKTAVLDANVLMQTTNLWVSVVVSVKTKEGEVYEACGEANTDELHIKKTENSLVRIAESRGRKRAYAQALGISPEDFFADKTKKSRMEDVDTPMCDLDGEEDADKGSRVDTPPEKKKLSLDDL